jgi:Bifunctional DNA primase/polymerase, N-terminal
MPNDSTNAALDFVARGVPVFPCASRAKKPLTPNGYKNATTVADGVRQWWLRQPDANVATPTGLTFDVFDVDPDGLNALFDQYGDDTAVITEGPCVRTPRGGVHLYYEPTGLGNKAGFRPGWDWRGTGGYVLLPPSVGPNGVTYTWHEEGGVTFDLDRPLPTVPSWLYELLEPPRTIPLAPIPPAPTSLSARLNAKSPKYTAAALEAEAHAVASAAVGTRNDQLNRSTHTLARLDELDPTTIETVMLAAALDAGLDEREALGTIRSALKARGLA